MLLILVSAGDVNRKENFMVYLVSGTGSFLKAEPIKF